MSESYKLIGNALQITKTIEEITSKTKEQLEQDKIGLEGEINTANNTLASLNAKIDKINEQLTMFPKE